MVRWVGAQAEDQVDILLELGALDINERVGAGKYKAIVLTEDAISRHLQILLRNCGFQEDKTGLLPYNGVTSIHLLKPLIRQIREISKATIVVHRDRDYMEPDEAEGGNPCDVVLDEDVVGVLALLEPILGLGVGHVEAARLAEPDRQLGAQDAPRLVLDFMKGKKKIAKLRKIFQESYGVRFDSRLPSGVPIDRQLGALGLKYFGSRDKT